MSRNNLEEEVVLARIAETLRKLQGADVNVDVRKLSAGWTGYHRIRDGKLRIIIEFDFRKRCAFVARVDWRGSVYK